MNTLSNKVVLFILISAMCLAGAMKTQASHAKVSDSCTEYAKADAELNDVYTQILREYSADKQFIARLKQAQRAWLAFTAAHLASLYPDPNPMTYGSVNRTCRCLVMTDLTHERTTQLRQWLKKAEEGDVCAGSRQRRD